MTSRGRRLERVLLERLHRLAIPGTVDPKTGRYSVPVNYNYWGGQLMRVDRPHTKWGKEAP
jgi:hypothetical protein